MLDRSRARGPVVSLDPLVNPDGLNRARDLYRDYSNFVTRDRGSPSSPENARSFPDASSARSARQGGTTPPGSTAGTGARNRPPSVGGSASLSPGGTSPNTGGVLTAPTSPDTPSKRVLSPNARRRRMDNFSTRAGGLGFPVRRELLKSVMAQAATMADFDFSEVVDGDRARQVAGNAEVGRQRAAANYDLLGRGSSVVLGSLVVEVPLVVQVPLVEGYGELFGSLGGRGRSGANYSCVVSNQGPRDRGLRGSKSPFRRGTRGTAEKQWQRRVSGKCLGTQALSIRRLMSSCNGLVA